MDLRGRTVLITGATGGIGGALAERLVAEGARVKVHGRHPGRMQALLARLPAGTPSLLADLAGAEGRAALAAFAAEGPAADVVVLNAASSHFGRFDQMGPAEIERLIATDLTAPILLTQALLPGLKRQPQARLVYIGSTLGRIGHPGFAAYGAAKAGLERFAEALGRELGGDGVGVLLVSPRATRTDANSSAADAMNAALGNAVDPPEAVAAAVVEGLRRDRRRVQLGGPERLFVRLNALLPTVVDRAMAGKLGTILRYATRPARPA